MVAATVAVAIAGVDVVVAVVAAKVAPGCHDLRHML